MFEVNGHGIKVYRGHRERTRLDSGSRLPKLEKLHLGGFVAAVIMREGIGAGPSKQRVKTLQSIQGFPSTHVAGEWDGWDHVCMPRAGHFPCLG